MIILWYGADRLIIKLKGKVRPFFDKFEQFMLIKFAKFANKVVGEPILELTSRAYVINSITSI